VNIVRCADTSLISDNKANARPHTFQCASSKHFTVVLFYKRMIQAGGAERLLLKEYKYFKRMGYTVCILSYRIDPVMLFGEVVDVEDLVELGDRFPFSQIRLAQFMKKNPDAIYLCASGQIDIYLASLISGVGYSLHLHHPNFMILESDDKYSIFQRKAFEYLKRKSYEEEALTRTKKSLTVWERVVVNIKAPFQIGSIKRARHTLVVSEFARHEKQIMYGVDSHVLYGAIETEVLSRAAGSIPTDAQGGAPVLLCVARHDPNKRIDILIRAYQYFLERNPKAILLIGGTGPETSCLRALTERLGLMEGVRFLGFIPDEDIYDYYAAADLFISIDFADYRITMFESLAMGTPVLISDEAECDEVLLSSGYVYMTEPAPHAVAVAIEKALDASPILDQEQLNQLLMGYTWEHFSRKVAAILEA